MRDGGGRPSSCRKIRRGSSLRRYASRPSWGRTSRSARSPSRTSARRSCWDRIRPRRLAVQVARPPGDRPGRGHGRAEGMGGGELRWGRGRGDGGWVGDGACFDVDWVCHGACFDRLSMAALGVAIDAVVLSRGPAVGRGPLSLPLDGAFRIDAENYRSHPEALEGRPVGKPIPNVAASCGCRDPKRLVQPRPHLVHPAYGDPSLSRSKRAGRRNAGARWHTIVHGVTLQA